MARKPRHTEERTGSGVRDPESGIRDEACAGAEIGRRTERAVQASAVSVPAAVEPIVELLAFQKRDVSDPARFTWSNWSRQTGKSFTKSLRRLLRGIERRRLQVFLSAGERQSRELMMKARQHVQAMKIAAEYREDTFFEGTSIKQLELSLPNGVRIVGLPANPMTARGFTGDALLDEFAMHRDDREIWAALFPTVLRGSGELDVCSTPKGVSNKFADLRNNEAFSRSTVTIHDAVRDGLDVDVAQLKAAFGDDLLWRQEFECEFLDEALSFLTYEMIRRCEDESLPLPICIDGAGDPACRAAIEAILARIPGLGEVFVGWDVARRRDLSVLWVDERVDGVLYARLIVEMANIRFRVQYQVLSALLKFPCVLGCSIDSTGIGMQLAEDATEDFGDWRVDGINFASSVQVANVSTPVKNKLAGQLRVKTEDCAVRIPECRAIRDDWHSIEKVITTGGNVRFAADRSKDGHADRFWAAALAVDAASGNERPWNGEGVIGARRVGLPYPASGRRMLSDEDEGRRDEIEDDPVRRERAAMAAI